MPLCEKPSDLIAVSGDTAPGTLLTHLQFQNLTAAGCGEGCRPVLALCQASLSAQKFASWAFFPSHIRPGVRFIIVFVVMMHGGAGPGWFGEFSQLRVLLPGEGGKRREAPHPGELHSTVGSGEAQTISSSVAACTEHVPESSECLPLMSP